MALLPDTSLRSSSVRNAASRATSLSASPYFYWTLILAFLALTTAIWAADAANGSNALSAFTWPLIILTGLGVAVALVKLLSRSDRGSTLKLITNLSPTMLLMTVFPFITSELTASSIGHTTTMLVVLMVSVTIPWITSTASAPVYGALEATPRDEHATFYYRFAQIWPALLATAIGPVILFSIVVNIFLGWGWPELAFYTIGLITNLIFAHSIIPAQETGRTGYVLAAWVAYAGFLFAFPHMWYVTPLAGATVCAFVMGRSMAGTFHPITIDRKRASTAVVAGMVAGSILWADKFFLVLLHPGETNYLMVYVALIPVVVAQAVYFSSEYVHFTRAIDRIRALIDSTPLRELGDDIRQISLRTERTVAVPVAMAAAVAVIVMLVASMLHFEYTGALLGFVIAPVVFCGLMLAAFQLAQLQLHREALIVGGIHLITCIICFFTLEPTVAYAVLTVVDLAATVWAVHLARKAMKQAAFELFWKEAIAW